MSINVEPDRLPPFPPNDPLLFGRADRFVNALAQCRELGITTIAAAPSELILELPYQEKIVGNPQTQVIHGGAITTLMDTTCGTCVICALPDFELCPTLDLRVDYMRPAQPGKAVRARATCYRVTSNIVFMRCAAYQEDPTELVAQCVATFMRIGKEATPLEFRQLINGGAL